MKIKFGFFIVALLALSATGCYYDNEETLYSGVDPLANCDTLNVTYSAAVSAIMTSNCTNCHNGSVQFDLASYSTLKPYVDNQTLLKAIKRNDTSVNPMPPSGAVSTCDIAKIEAWINSGAPNN